VGGYYNHNFVPIESQPSSLAGTLEEVDAWWREFNKSDEARAYLGIGTAKAPYGSNEYWILRRCAYITWKAAKQQSQPVIETLMANENAQSQLAVKDAVIAELRSALERLRTNAKYIFDKKPVRDWAETLAEADAALENTKEQLSALREEKDAEREKALDDARLAYSAHNASTPDGREDCIECGHNWRSAIHLRDGETKESRIASLKRPLPGGSK
jgi:hypothetical protein